MKPFTIIKAFGAGVVAVYAAVNAADYVRLGYYDMATESAKQWLYATDEMKHALGVPN